MAGLRGDFALSDLTLLLSANAGVAAEPREVAVTYSRRLAASLLHSFRAEGARPLPPPAPLDLRNVHAKRR